MAGYATSNPPKLLVPRVGAVGPAIWTYYTATDADGTVNGSGYFTDGVALGMALGDMVYMYDANGNLGSVLYVSAVGATAVTTSFAAVA